MNRKKKVLQIGLFALLAVMAPSLIRADIVPPPQRLHRIGFEVFKKKPQELGDKAKTERGKDGQDAPLTPEEEKELQQEFEELKTLFPKGKTEWDLGGGTVLKYADMAKELRKNFRKFKALGEAMKNGELIADDAWKYPRDVTDAERTVINAKIVAVKPELQTRFDVEYAKMNSAGELKRIGLPAGRYIYRYHRVKRGMATENALTVVKRILEGDDKFRSRCDGVPIEWLANALKCPEPTVNDNVFKERFRDWSMVRMPQGLNDSERRIVFDWQFHVVEREKRAWRKLVWPSDDQGETTFARRKRTSDDRLMSGKGPLEPGFEDFSQKLNAADFVVFWYDKAVATGLKPTAEDKNLREKARASKTPYAGHVNISIASGYPKKMKIHHSVLPQELKDARLALTGGLGMDERSCFDLELDEPSSGFLKTVADVFGSDMIQKFSIRATRSGKIDLSPLADFKQGAQTLSLQNCNVENCALLSAWKRLERFEAKDCELGRLTFLSGCAGLRSVKLESCVFSGTDNLWASERLGDLSISQSRDVVDLSVVRKLEHLATLNIEGCSVTNFTALKAHPNLQWLKMKNLKGGVESLTFLADNSSIRDVEYCREDFNPSVYMDYARAVRNKKYVDNPTEMLAEAVKDRDLIEIRRLCGAKVNVDEALREFEFSNEQDVKLFELLIQNASQKVATEQLKKCVGMFGYGNYYSSKQSFVPTNRVEIISVLMAQGARPDDAIDDMAHPAESDLPWFKLMLGKASKKVLTEILQKNIKSFGDHSEYGSKNGPSADRHEVVRLVLRHGADPNARNFFRQTALGNAVEYDGDMELVKILLENGADATLMPPNTDLIEILYQKGDSHTWGTNRYELVELLLRHGFDANARGLFGKTSLGELLFFGNTSEGYDLKMAELLLKHGADPNVAQGKGEGSATDLAYVREAKDFLALLVKHGGKVSDEAKTKKVKGNRNNGARRESYGTPPPAPRFDEIHKEFDRFNREMRDARTSEARRKVMDEHHQRMRKIHMSPIASIPGKYEFPTATGNVHQISSPSHKASLIEEHPHQVQQKYAKDASTGSQALRKGERRSIFNSKPKEEKDDYGNEKHRGKHYVRVRGVGGLVGVLLEAMGVNVGALIGIGVLVVFLCCVMLFSNIDRDWRCRVDQNTQVIEIGEARESMFTCQLCHSRRSHNDSAIIALHGNRQSVRVGRDKTISVETGATCRVPVCSACECAAFEYAGKVNVAFRIVCVLVFCGVSLGAYLLYFTIASSIVMGLIAVTVVGLLRISLKYVAPRKLPISMDVWFSCVPEIASLQTRGFSIGRSHADVVQTPKTDDWPNQRGNG